MGGGKGKVLKRKQLKRLAKLYGALNRGKFDARVDEPQVEIAEMTDAEFDAFVQQARQFRAPQPD